MATVAEKKRSGQELRWSVRRKTDAVMRLLRGEDLDTVARELRVEAHRLAAWRDEFMAGGAEALKVRPTEPADRKLRKAERQIGRLTGSDNSTWPHSDDLIWPHPRRWNDSDDPTRETGLWEGRRARS